MCQICGNNQIRTWTHALSVQHKKKLIAYFKKKINN